MRRLATVGTAVVVGTGASAGAAHAAAIAITPAKACYLSGEKITLTGNGYTPDFPVEVALDGTSLGQLAADPAGNIAAEITLGRMRGAKSHALSAVDTTNGANAATASFLATTFQVTVKPRNTRAGRRLKLRGYGFMGMANVFMHVRGPGGYKSDNRLARPQGRAGRSACAGGSCGRRRHRHLPRPVRRCQAVLQEDAPARAGHDEGIPAHMTETHAIVGAGLAGGKAAETLREEGFDGRVVLVGAEPDRPYERPPLSKDYLRGEAERETAYVHESAYYGEHDIELRTETVAEAIDLNTREVALAGGERVPFHRLLLATGAEPRRLPGAESCLLPARLPRLRRPPRRARPGRPHGRDRRRLDRLRGRRVGAPEGARGDADRAGRRRRSRAYSAASWGRSMPASTATTGSRF